MLPLSSSQGAVCVHAGEIKSNLCPGPVVSICFLFIFNNPCLSPRGHIAMLDCTPVLTDTSIKCMFVSHMVIFGVSVSVLHTLNLIFYIKVCAEMFAQLAV